MSAATGRRYSVYLPEVRIGGLREGPAPDQVVFEYDDAYRDRVDATPLSMSIPLTQASPSSAAATAWFRGLLPENPMLLERIARSAGTTSSYLIGMVAHVGRDVAGAVRVLPEGEVLDTNGGVQWLDDDDVAARLGDLRDLTAGRRAPARDDNGRWSLPGAQAKIALRRDPHSGRWGIPTGAEPTTHILKPAIAGLAAFDVAEATMQQAARRIGLRAADADVLLLSDGSHALVTRRYDRALDPSGTWRRRHQEDLCQALGVPPAMKYQSDGGPGIAVIGRLIRALPGEQAAASARRFFDSLAFNYAVAGTDGHARNTSLLLSGADATLAPLYDLNSALPYTRPFGRRYRGVAKLHSAFVHGTTDAFTRMEARDWVVVAGWLGIDADAARVRLRHVAASVRETVPQIAAELADRAELPAEERFPWASLLDAYHARLRALR